VEGCDLAAYHLARGHFAKALAALPASSPDAPTDAGTLNVAGATLLLNGRLEESLQAFDRALALDAGFAPARFNRALALLRLRRSDAAAAEFERVAKEGDPRLRATAAFHRAIIEDLAGRHAAAEKWLERSHASDGSFDAAILYLGIVREKQRSFESAAVAYHDYLRRRPDSVVAKLRFGVMAQRAGRIDTARRYFAAVIRDAPASAEAQEARKYLVMWE
jgi:tetratricopeptide (TPR) repeat protein